MMKLIVFVQFIALFAISEIDAQNREKYKKKPFNLSFKETYKEQEMKSLKMIGTINRNGVQGTRTERIQGKLLRALRFQNITQKVEQKYGLPKNIVLAMVMQETGGTDLLPNGIDDGGLGLCHMQPLIASQFDLKTHQNCKKLRSKSHGKALRNLILKHKYDRKKLIKYDDRFHPILNLDAVGRMLKYYYFAKPVKGKTRIQSAIYRYAGSINYAEYYRNVQFFLKSLADKKLIKDVEKEFNKRNPKLLIGNKKGTFKRYIQYHQQQNYNYGLAKYK